jgi:hypothetical protein
MQARNSHGLKAQAFQKAREAVMAIEAAVLPFVQSRYLAERRADHDMVLNQRNRRLCENGNF